MLHLACVHLLLAVIYNHMKYGNVHLQMSTHSTPFLLLFWDLLCLPSTLWMEPPFVQLSEGESLLEQREMILMNINAYHTPLNKLTDQLIKLRLPSYLMIITGLSLLQHKKGNVMHICIHVLYM